MSIANFRYHTINLLDAIEGCYASKRILPCLILLYSGIDAMASLDSDLDEPVRTKFVRWSEAYVLNGRSLGVSALDLYAARCGILHAFSPDSKLADSGHAQRIGYAWGAADVMKLAKSLSLLAYPALKSIHVRDLIDAFRNGLADYIDAVENDPAMQQKFNKGAGLWFSNLGIGQMDDFLDIADQSLST